MLARDAVLLPSELWDHVLSFVPPADQQHAALALSRALPRALVSSATFVRHLRISRPGQAAQAAHHFRYTLPDTTQAVKTLTVEVWRDDPQLVVNLACSLPFLRAIDLTVGPLAAPDHLDDLLDPASLARTGRGTHLEQLALRFNPYCAERSYYTFLKGAYFDTAPISLARTSPQLLPALRRLSFVQDLPPTYGSKHAETPAFGLHDLAEALEDASAPPAPVVVPVSGKFGRVLNKDKMDFAQPIIFFQLGCITRLATSALAAQLTHLTLRLPRRALLPALTDIPAGQTSLPALRHLDLSTTHIVDDARVPTLLRLHPALETLVLDRCSGLVGRDAVEEPTALATLRWLGKCCASPPLLRAEEALRDWRRLSKARPASAPAPSTPWAAPIPPVKDVALLPPPSTLRALGLGLHPPADLAPRGVARAWRSAFAEGYADGVRRAEEKARDVSDRWERWARTGKLVERSRRVVLFADAVPVELAEAVRAECDAAAVDGDDDPLFARFCAERGLVALPALCAPGLVRALTLSACAAYAAAADAFVLCLVPDCTDRPGRPHLALGAAGTPEGPTEERRERERRAWQEEYEEEHGERGWRRPEGEHSVGCAHLEGRRAWALD
ncbi:hypothetical protein JCM3770_002112 [Rhodotorula araucariae]